MSHPNPAGLASRIALIAALVAPSAMADGPRPGEAAALRAKIRGQVDRELAEHWYPAALDREHGGFRQNFARDWSPRPDSDKFSVFQARMTWTAAAYALATPDRRDEYLGYARWGVDCLDRTLRDGEQGGFHWSVGLDGRVDARSGGEKHVYGTAFILYAASKAYEATRDPRALAVARDAYAWLEAHAHDPKHGGYFEATTRAGVPIKAWDPARPLSARVDRLGIYYGFKTMNSHIHLLEGVAEFYRVAPTPAVRARLEELLAVVRDRIAAAPGALNLYLSADWRAAPAHDSFGHDVETAYLLIEAAEALGRADDDATWRVARSLIDHALDWGWDARDGGFYDKGDVFNGKPYDTTKVWWAQAEGMNALLLMHLKYGRETDRYWEAFRLQWDFIDRHLIDPVHGGWYWDTDAAGTKVGVDSKATPWKANYHTGRAMLNVARMLGEVEKESAPVKGP